MGARKKESSYGCWANRNLGKSQLGGVIFGATNTTIGECLSKQLFGLPKEHLEYVEKINPGLPLFLLNYTDRKLYGVFEAASHGKKDIDPYAWTCDGKQKTPFSAQVQVRVQSARQPLTETMYKPAIVDNYYTQIRFWFELDHSQTNRLLSLFSSQPVSTSLFNTNWLKAKNPSVSFSGKSVNSDISDDTVGTVVEDEKELVCMKLKELALNRKFLDRPAAHEDESGYVNVNVDPHSAAREYETTRVNVDSHSAASEAYMTSMNNTSSMTDSVIAQLIEKVDELTACNTEQDNEIDSMKNKIIHLEQELAEARNEIRYLKGHCKMLEHMAVPSEEIVKADTTPSDELHSDMNLNGCDDLIFLVGGYDGRSWFSSLDAYSPSKDHIKSLKPMNTERCYAPASILNGQLYVFGGGTLGDWYDTVESYDPVVNEWTSRPSLNAKRGSLAGATLNGKIYAVGGGSDDEYYSAVEMLDLDIGAWIPTRSMLEKRFSLAVVELNGALYAVGGYDGRSYLKSAERFDPREHSWTKIESMNTMRGCPCLVTLNEKLYVIGGFDGNEMIPSIEIYDPRRGSWVNGEPMKYSRGFAAAAAVKESIYVFGGLKKTGEEINHTVQRYVSNAAEIRSIGAMLLTLLSKNKLLNVECYKEGQGWETVDTKAGGMRCFFSAVGLSK